MLHAIHKLLLCLALAALAHMQAVGVPTGYFCGCTGEQTGVADCDAMACHPHHAHADGCAEGGDGDHSTADPHAGKPAGEPAHPGHHHRHRTTGESPVALTFPGAPTVPPAVFFVLVSPIPMPEMAEPNFCLPVAHRPPRPPVDTGPTAGVRIVRSVVRLV